jgi:hypothetical protein
MSGTKISTQDKIVLIGYAGIVVAYALLFVVKYNHLKHNK